MGSITLRVNLVPRSILVHEVWNHKLIHVVFHGEHSLLPYSLLSYGHWLLQLHGAPRCIYELDRGSSRITPPNDNLHSLMYMRRLLLSFPEAC